MADAVSVACNARLHLGFLDIDGALGRRFGSIGMALDAPQTRIRLTRSATPRVDGPERDRAARYLETILRHLGVASCHSLTVTAAIPPHAGLGSGTQLALAVAAAVRRLHGLPADPTADAYALGRGQRSGIGIALFQHGGFVVDGGCGSNDSPPPMLARLAVPEGWRVVLLRDERHSGLSGRDEAAAFTALPPFAPELAARICHLVLMQVLPALAEDDLARFGDAIGNIQQIVGDHFAPAQGGRFTSPRVAAALSLLGAGGASGLGQSSWGPSGFAFVGDHTTAAALAARLRHAPQGEGLNIAICRPLNLGATITGPA